MVTAVIKAKDSSKSMLEWQYKTILAEIQQIELHESGDCPCILSDLNPPEKCIGKHTLNVFSLCQETSAMDSHNAKLLLEIAEKASYYHDKFKDFICHTGDLPDLREWARSSRKMLEPIYYSCSSKKAKLSDGELQDIAQLFDVSAPKIRVSGTCTENSCSLKVKGSIENSQMTTATGLPDAIDSVIRHLEKRAGSKASPLTYAIGSTSLTRYELRYVVKESSLLIPSNNPITFEPNPDYPQELQPRLRGRAANKAQVLTMAANLDPDALLDDFHSIDRGAPIVDDSGVVLSGNGRVMAIQHAVSEFPKSYAVYKEHLEHAVETYGLQIGKIKSPVLVRELVSKVDKRTFVEEANASTTIAASAVEVARSDAQKITASMLSSLEVPEGQSVEDALRSSANGAFVSSFLSKLPANERAGVADAKGQLNQDGIRRITMAIFVNVFPGDVGIRLSEKFFESTDVNVRNVFNGIVGALGKLAQSEALVRDGQRGADLGIGDDLARVVVAYSDIKKTQGMTVDKYLSQAAMFERQLNKFQEKMLAEIDSRARSGRRIAALLKAYADVVMSSTPPAQGSLIPGAALTKEQAFDAAIVRSQEVATAALLDIVRLFDSTRRGQVESRLAHNQKIVGSIPASATSADLEDSVINGLKKSAAEEQKAADTYDKRMKEAKNPKTASLYKEIIEEELVHFQQFVREIKRLTGKEFILGRS